TGSHEERQCGVQPSGNPDYSGFRIGMVQPFLKSHRLDRQDLFTSLRPRLFIRRDEWSSRELSCQLCLLFFNMEGNPNQTVPFCCLKCRVLPTLAYYPLKIELGIDDLIVVSARLF